MEKLKCIYLKVFHDVVIAASFNKCRICLKEPFMIYFKKFEKT